MPGGVPCGLPGTTAHVGSTSLLAARASQLRDHWTVWRPEWTAERTCLYWYLTFTEGQLNQVKDEETRDVVARTDWLDPVPPAWSHVTVCDVGFAEDLHQADVEAVTSQVADALTGEEKLRLDLGPIEAFASASSSRPLPSVGCGRCVTASVVPPPRPWGTGTPMCTGGCSGRT